MAHRRGAARFLRVLLELGKAGIVLYLSCILIKAMPRWILIAITLAACVWGFLWERGRGQVGEEGKVTKKEIQSRAAAIAADIGGEAATNSRPCRISGVVLKPVAEEREDNARIAEAIAPLFGPRGSQMIAQAQ